MELVTIRQVRRKRQIRDAGARVELSLDEVTVIAGGREVGRFAELEAELRRGDEARLAELAAIFDADLTLSRATESKLDAALAVIARARGRSGAGRGRGGSRMARRPDADERDRRRIAGGRDHG